MYAEGAKQLLEMKIQPAAEGHTDATSCWGVNGFILMSYKKTPKCWDCYLKNGLREPRKGESDARRDHWVVVCAAAKDGKVAKEIYFDYWAKGANQGGDVSEFDNKYPIPGQHDWDPAQMGYTCSSNKPTFYGIATVPADQK
jgi:hypothetical protein